MQEAPLKINHVVYTTVEAIKPNESVGHEIDPENEKGPMLRIVTPLPGWWVHFEGSRESLFFDGDKPFEKGDKVKITFEKVDNV